MLRMCNNNPEIRFAGSSGRLQHAISELAQAFQSESKCETIDMKTIFYFNESKMHFHKNGFFARSLILKVRAFGTRKWPIRICFVFRCNLSLLARFCRFLKFLLVLILHCKCRGMCCDTYPVESSNVQHIALFYLYAIGGGSPRKKAPKSAGSSKTHMPSVKTPADKKQEEPPSSAPLPGVTSVRKSSVLRAASALGIINEKPQPIIYTPRRAWVSQPTTDDLLRGREIRRLRYGTDIDFTDYKPPFQKHITLKAQALEAEDN